ncbi:MAG: UDP-glucose/GDP-mannose dehydrogenase family protein [Actinomycetes bacterium]
MTLRLTVLGTGYLGATHAACMADLGFDVLGMDVDSDKIESLSQGVAPFFEPDLNEVLSRNIQAGRLRFTTSFEEAAAFGDVHFICVGTPQRSDSNAADMQYVDAVVDGLAPHLQRPCLIVGKSTVPVGTAERVAKRVAALSPVGHAAEVAWNPEFLREGHAVTDTLRPDRLVIGVTSKEAEETLRQVYGPLLEAGVPLIVTDLATSQLVKVAANAFLATKISFINAMSELCDAAGGDILQLSDALAHDKRIGGQFLRAGLGFGGGCLPKDIRAFMARAGELGVDDALTFLREVDSINLRRRSQIAAMARNILGGYLRDQRICILGAAFKPNSDDVRDSPALHVAAALHQDGAHVVVHDPKANANAERLFPNLEYVDSVEVAVRGADVVMVLTEWEQFLSLDPETISPLVNHRVVIDGRLCLDPEKWRAAGWQYHAPGRPQP